MLFCSACGQNAGAPPTSQRRVANQSISIAPESNAHPGVAADSGKISDTLATQCSDSGTTVSGIDVSAYQGAAIDWQSVADDGKDFAIAKVSEGTTFADSAFANNWSGMGSVGMVRGAYHFFHPSDDPQKQADHMMDLIDAQGGLQPGDLPPVLDVEVTDSLSASKIVSALNATISAIEDRTGLTPIVYTSPYFWHDTLGDPSTDAILWVAMWTSKCPQIPTAFADWTFWQNSSTGTVPSISGAVDLDEFNGDIDALYAVTVQW